MRSQASSASAPTTERTSQGVEQLFKRVKAEDGSLDFHYCELRRLVMCIAHEFEGARAVTMTRTTQVDSRGCSWTPLGSKGGEHCTSAWVKFTRILKEMRTWADLDFPGRRYRMHGCVGQRRERGVRRAHLYCAARHFRTATSLHNNTSEDCWAIPSSTTKSSSSSGRLAPVRSTGVLSHDQNVELFTSAFVVF